MSSVFARRSGIKRAYPVKASTKIESFVAVFLTAGVAVPHAAAAGTSKFCGVSTFSVENTGADGAVHVEVEHQEIALRNSGDITNAEIGKLAYFKSAIELTKDHSTNSRPIAGTVTQLDGDLVWVKPAID